MKIKNILYILAIGTLSSLMVGCIQEEKPEDVVSEKQVANMPDTQEALLNGIASYMVTYNTWGSSSYYLNDWGFPCQMCFREVNGEDFPIYKSTYDYWTYHENGTYASSYTIYTWYFYYSLIRNCNNLIQAINTETASEESLHFLGSALAFRAMAYLDLARSFEFKPTGYEALDAKAEASGLWGLTVPIVTEKTTKEEQTANPRADYCTMMRFIMTDLENASKYLNGYNPTDKSLPGTDVVNGLMARTWLELGSRLDENTKYINNYTAKLAESNKQNDGYKVINLTSAKECYENAYKYADAAIANASPVTKSQWHDSKTGFNTANQGWLWRCRIGTKEQEPTYYCSFVGQVSSEPKAGLAYSYNAFRCISSSLYKRLQYGDWRKTTWIDPEDAGDSTASVMNKYATLLDAKGFAKLPAYANLKFRPGNGDIDDLYTWMIGDLPVMRMEEMVFIKAEAIAKAEGYEKGYQILYNFIQNYRMEANGDEDYEPCNEVEDMDTFMDELMYQKRIEFWGEGICYFDYKRLNLQVDRTKSTNIEDAFKLISKKGYCAPWMNYFIPKAETQRNTKCLANPDVSGDYTSI